MGSTKYQTNENPQIKSQSTYFSYEQNQFNDFLRKLIDVESKLEDFKIDLAQNPDFICDDIFSLFEKNNKGYLDEEDLKNGLNLIGLNVSDQDIRLLMKRFDLQKTGRISYADFFDIIVPFEKNYRQRVECRNPTSDSPTPGNFSPNTLNGLGELFNLILAAESEINNMRKLFGTLRLNLRDIFGLLDKNRCGFFSNEDLLEYLDSNGLLSNIRDADLLFIRLDKNRNGKIDFFEVEDEIQTIY
jgi:Ca2+-binding EF-hand superfamily protein